ncbi:MULTISPECIES: outer membrane protein assembly factor BamE [Gammaproteobacteria]|uniref:Outer membrane protein assembly factor BamE n=2 Tax=Plesiomonas shigelloides TaxID=703 RepID=R8ANB1_PLESH|nr:MULTISPECIES: outer membrane protein assembly factor BamE [Gammaproteobacteria]MDO4689316.1 outer membrane protein assembly factor BamE [Plesiomonas sp.]HDX8588917.1 outer membrane protein assembly factor BamE [Aeromonas dhakensis]AVQ88305.1 outer membrane protein assembly factor BamE [Plesiomonas shigelloides]EON87798.1 outer membrane biogenesis protein BamE [Plesiomonas shigelloides 302-73]KAB7661478.1 outer membrane protein assembly factor BamE [Plesiomonas shigelloides]
MRCKTLITACLLTMLTAGCSTVEKVVYRIDVDQGNYLEQKDVAQLRQGMNKDQVLYLLGTPLLNDPFGSDTWYYVFRQQKGHDAPTQQTLVLSFDSQGLLSQIKNQDQLPANLEHNS